jgi:hypothetical protein
MQELITHLSNDNLPSLYWNPTSEVIEFGELTRHTYQMIARALKEGADILQATALDLTWSREETVIGKVSWKPSLDSQYPKSFASQIRKIIDKDPIMQKWTRVISDEAEAIVIEFIPQRI